MYHESVPTLAQRVAKSIRQQELLKPGARVGVAVSGGLDSVALLRLLLELRDDLGVVLSVVHFNHQLRGKDSDADEEFVRALASEHNLELFCDSGSVKSHAEDEQLSLEAAARAKRYEFFHRLLDDNKLDHIATAHTLDDQAETVLLRVVRGAGTRGLAGIYPELRRQSSVVGRQPKTIIRPLLEFRRFALEHYLKDVQQAWREDGSNRDLRHARNRVRHGLMPRLERHLNPAVRENLADTANIARAEEDYWQAEVSKLLPQLWNSDKLSLPDLTKLPLAMQRRVVRAAAESRNLHLEFRHVEEILELAYGRTSAAALPHDWSVSLEKNFLCFNPKKNAERAGKSRDYEYSLDIPGRVDVVETKTCFEAVMVSADAGYNRGHLLEPSVLARHLLIRNWRAGDRFWPAHTKAPKKIKELLQERHVTGAERATWPVIVSGEEVIWLRGFPVPASHAPRNGTKEAIVIREASLG